MPMREQDRGISSMRRLLHEISMLMACEAVREMSTPLIEIATPLETMR